jgi:Flp pilus assembly protein TadG
MRPTSLLRNGAAAAARSQRGSMAVEMVLLTPAFVLLLLFLVGVGRVVEAQGQVDGAARDGARAASVQRDRALVGSAVDQAANGDLSPQAGKNMCPDGMTASWQPDTDPATNVRVTVMCEINLAVVPGLGTVDIHGQAVAPLDAYMQRDW